MWRRDAHFALYPLSCTAWSQKAASCQYLDLSSQQAPKLNFRRHALRARPTRCWKYGLWCAERWHSRATIPWVLKALQLLTSCNRSRSSSRLQMPTQRRVWGKRRSPLLSSEYKKVMRPAASENNKAAKPPKGSATDWHLCPDVSELSLPSTMKTDFPDEDDLLNFTLTIEPDEGMYKGGRFHFSFAINQDFPHSPPKVKCTQKIYHPNIDLEGNVCLNILREDWKPVLNLQSVMIGLQVCGTTGTVYLWRNRALLICSAPYSSYFSSQTHLIPWIKKQRKIYGPIGKGSSGTSDPRWEGGL